MRSFVSRKVPAAVDAERHEVGNTNPDIGMVEDNVTSRSRGNIHIIYVGYCWDPHWIAKHIT